MLKYIAYFFLIYLLLRFIIGFLIPVFKTGWQIKNQFNDMRQRMEKEQQQSAANNTQQTEKSTKNTPAGEYIDFEEVK